MKSQVLKGSIILIIAGIFCKILGAFYRIPLSNIIGAEGMGIYQMIFPVFSLCLIFATGGIVNTMSQLIARARARGESVKKILLQGFFYCLALGTILSLLLFFLASPLSALQGSINAALGYRVAAVALFFTCLIIPIRGYFQGYENMTPTAISQIIEQIFKVFLGLTFAVVFLENSLALSVAGAFLGILIGEFFALIYLIIKFLKNSKIIKITKNIDENNEKTLKNAKKIEKNGFFRINFQLMINFLIIPTLAVIDSFLVVNILENYFSSELALSLYGLQSGMVNSLINFPVVISVSVSLALLPSISYLIENNQGERASQTISTSCEILWIILLPCVVIFFSLSEFILSFLYSSLDENLLIISSQLLKISAVEILLISFLQVSSITLQALGKNLTPTILLIISGVVKIILTCVLTLRPEINIFGLSVASVIFYTLAASMSLYILKRYIKFSLPQKTLLVTLVSSAVMGALLYLTDIYIPGFMIKVLVMGAVILVTYIVPLIYFQVIDVRLLARLARRRSN